MRFLKTLTLNRRAIYDSRVALDTSDNFTLADSSTMILPKNSASISSPTEGQMRYNTSTHQVEVYQGSSATWRSIRYKESTEITYENYTGDGSSTVYGPLSPQPPTVVETSDSGATNSWSGKNLIVIVGNVFQTHGNNYLIKDGATLGPPYVSGQKYIEFTSSTPGLSTPIVIIRGFDR